MSAGTKTDAPERPKTKFADTLIEKKHDAALNG